MPHSLPPEMRDEFSQFSPTREKGRRWKDFFNRKRLVFLLSLFVVACLAVGYGHYTDPGPAVEKREIVIPRGGVWQVASLLQKEGFLARGEVSRFFFCVAVLLTAREGEIHAAELSFPAHVSIAHTLYILRHGQPVAHYITIAEGLTAKRIVQLLQKVPALHGDVPFFREGYFFPQTFSYVWGTNRASLVLRADNLMQTHLNTAWAQRDQEMLGDVITTPEQLLVLASLIERESKLSEERPEIARVFINRLKKGMRLQSDPTVIYALSQGWGRLDHPLVHDELAVDSPYNTYKVVGLPPGPICSPSLSALKAAAHPAQGNKLYFVASGHGGHHFSETLSEQNAHIRAYRMMQREH